MAQSKQKYSRHAEVGTPNSPHPCTPPPPPAPPMHMYLGVSRLYAFTFLPDVELLVFFTELRFPLSSKGVCIKSFLAFGGIWFVSPGLDFTRFSFRLARAALSNTVGKAKPAAPTHASPPGLQPRQREDSEFSRDGCHLHFLPLNQTGPGWSRTFARRKIGSLTFPCSQLFYWGPGSSSQTESVGSVCSSSDNYAQGLG